MIGDGSVVRSLAGRDRGSLYLVLETDGIWLQLVDGRQRRLDAPKRKKIRHVESIGRLPAAAGEKLAARELTNSEIRRLIADISAERESEQADGVPAVPSNGC